MRFEAFDFETQGGEGTTFALEPFRLETGEASVSSVAISRAQAHTWVPTTQATITPTKEFLRQWLVDCKERDVTICGWNVAFDISWLIAMGLRDEVFALRWMDGMLLWKHLEGGPTWLPNSVQSFGLKAAVAKWLPWAEGYDEGIDFEDNSAEATAARVEYNRLDTCFTYMLCYMLWSRLTKSQRRTVLLEAACLPMVAEASVKGIKASRSGAEALAQKLDEDAMLARAKLLIAAREPVPDTVLRSPTQLKELLFDKWKLRPLKLTNKGAYSTDRDVLTQLAAEDPRAGHLNDYREATNNRAKFAVGCVESLDYNGDGYVRPVPRVAGTYTGRMTYSSKSGRGTKAGKSGIALHQWKRDPAFRGVIEAPPGHTLLEFDFAGQEYRWMAVFSRDPMMLRLCGDGEDPHSYMGAQVGRKDYKQFMADIKGSVADIERLRQLGKVANLSLQYRTSANTLRRVARMGYGLTISEQEAADMHATYRRTYPGVVRYWRDAINTAADRGYAETITGRRIKVSGGDWRELKWARESTCVNSPIQGSGAEQKYLALAAMRDWLPTVEGRFYFELHDGIFIIVPDHMAQKALVEGKQLLSNLPYEKAWGVKLPVNFPVDAKIGKTWGGLEKA